MNQDTEHTDPDLLDERSFQLDYHRKNMEEIRAAVTRGTTGIEASYYVEQGSLLTLARESS